MERLWLAVLPWIITERAKQTKGKKIKRDKTGEITEEVDGKGRIRLKRRKEDRFELDMSDYGNGGAASPSAGSSLIKAFRLIQSGLPKKERFSVRQKAEVANKKVHKIACMNMTSQCSCRYVVMICMQQVHS